jgi:hypothetical protein
MSPRARAQQAAERAAAADATRRAHRDLAAARTYAEAEVAWWKLDEASTTLDALNDRNPLAAPRS